jgi:predicted CoA-substrate-specific enzyme activase
MSRTIKSLGICLGASTISVVTMEAPSNPEDKGLNGFRSREIDHALYPHDGDPKRTVVRALDHLAIDEFQRIAVTGRKFRGFLNLSSLPEPEAVELAYAYAKPRGISCPAVISAGGETFMAYLLTPDGRIANVLTGNKCASGTGEFFLQQLRRMDTSLEQAAQWAAETEPYPVSGRCSVFCKSDCTHATNKGIPRAQVTAGLCRMMANKILELLKKVERRNIMITGGTTANRMMLHYLNKEITGLIVPRQAPYFEALGAALWALSHPTRPYPSKHRLFISEAISFDTLAPLKKYAPMVTFESIKRARLQPDDRCILGLDVGSTTTKAVLIRAADDALLASVYLRTNGDPVGASRRCYQALYDQVQTVMDPAQLVITGLGVCGSGRQIAGLHALTDGIINEIVAHATAAVHFDSQVDTIFEIGGQDAKYTYITNGVPSDYAMNEACSAGTGSFLEESALESLAVPMEEIAQVALSGRRPPNFNDQCAAFIASDIKNAIHEGVERSDIVAGLVYSICMNYTNRVKGNRPVGQKVFMQGGVCYNRAVPMAMAALTGKPIVVPPEPGLMGAYGAALTIKERLQNDLLTEGRFDLATLIHREVGQGHTFICKGGRQRCDRRCEIARIKLEGRTYPFGGACNRWYNLRRRIKYDTANLDLVRLRQKMVFETFGPAPASQAKPGQACVGFNRSFLVNTYYPLYASFFQELGFAPVLPESPHPGGVDRRNAAFCYPAELAHGFFYQLISAPHVPPYIFLPHFKAVPSLDGNSSSQVCPFVQGETFYLQATFRREIEMLKARGVKFFTPLMNLSEGERGARRPLVETARQMGIPKRHAEGAFDRALARQLACMAEMQAVGKKVLAQLERHPERLATVIFARPYNGFAPEAHMGIPHKFASRGVTAIPLDFLSLDGQKSKRHMYWGMGQRILMAARLVARHPQLFGTYITNFSCGPDSFLIGYFRRLMDKKPSLTLELDSHTADAGLETRIEAFLDIISAYRQLSARSKSQNHRPNFLPARTGLKNGRPVVTTSSGETLGMTDPRVTVLFPSMGKIASEALAAAFRSAGFNAKAHPPADERILKIGRGHTTCKECLPLILTTGTLLNYINNGRRPDEVLIYFMPTGSGPCRFGQYYIYMEDLVKKLRLRDVAMFSLSSEDGYEGLSTSFHRKGWWAVVVSDAMEDIRSMLLVNAAQRDKAMALFNQQWNRVLEALENGRFEHLIAQLKTSARQLAEVPLKRSRQQVPVVSLTGEIYVRRDSLSRQHLTEYLADQGFATICAPVAEWVHYSDYLLNRGLSEDNRAKVNRIKALIKQQFMKNDERRIKTILSRSGLIDPDPVNVHAIIRTARRFISTHLGGEAILTIGSAMHEVVSRTCGVIAIGPFGCMPNRLSEAILSETMCSDDKLAADTCTAPVRQVLTQINDLPFLSIETDGSPFPQLISAKLEAFCLRAKRLHEQMMFAHQDRPLSGNTHLAG